MTENTYNQIGFNRLTKAQYDELVRTNQINARDLYFITDDNSYALASSVYTKSELDTLLASVNANINANINTAIGNLATVASTGSYNDLVDVPTNLASQSYVNTQISNAIDNVLASAPAAFDTLKEIADWIGDGNSGAQAMINQISAKANANSVYTKTEVDNLLSDKQDTLTLKTINNTAITGSGNISIPVVNANPTVESGTTPTDLQYISVDGVTYKIPEQSQSFDPSGYYVGNLPVSSVSSSTTSPTFQTVTASNISTNTIGSSTSRVSTAYISNIVLDTSNNYYINDGYNRTKLKKLILDSTIERVNGNSTEVITMPTKSGTMALTSDMSVKPITDSLDVIEDGKSTGIQLQSRAGTNYDRTYFDVTGSGNTVTYGAGDEDICYDLAYITFELDREALVTTTLTNVSKDANSAIVLDYTSGSTYGVSSNVFEVDPNHPDFNVSGNTLYDWFSSKDAFLNDKTALSSSTLTKTYQLSGGKYTIALGVLADDDENDVYFTANITASYTTSTNGGSKLTLGDNSIKVYSTTEIDDKLSNVGGGGGSGIIYQASLDATNLSEGDIVATPSDNKVSCFMLENNAGKATPDQITKFTTSSSTYLTYTIPTGYKALWYEYIGISYSSGSTSTVPKSSFLPSNVIAVGINDTDFTYNSWKATTTSTTISIAPSSASSGSRYAPAFVRAYCVPDLG